MDCPAEEQHLCLKKVCSDLGVNIGQEYVCPVSSFTMNGGLNLAHMLDETESVEGPETMRWH